MGRGIAVDARGRAYIAGATNSTDFPTTRGALQRSYGGGPFDAFVVRLTARGRLDCATFLGDTHYDEANAIAVDARNRAVVTGRTVSPAFPVAGGLRPQVAGGAFVARLDAGGPGSATPPSRRRRPRQPRQRGVRGRARSPRHRYVTGVTNAARFPRVGHCSPARGRRGRVRARRAARHVLYSTYLGRREDDVGRAIAVTPGGTTYVTGRSGGRTFLARVAAGGRRLARWSWRGGDGGVGIALGGDGRVHVDATAVIAVGPSGAVRSARNAGGDVIVTG